MKLQNGEWVSLENREPEAEYRALRQQWEEQLNCKHVFQVGKAPIGTETNYCVPIDAAMQKVLSLPSRVKTISEEPNARPEDYGLDRPTAASSGRMTEKGKEQ